jgi:hypothetical protein
MGMSTGKFPRNAPRQPDKDGVVRRRFPTRVDAVVDSVLDQRKLSARVAEARIFQAFMDVAGDAVRKRARPQKLRGSELTIAVDSASWRQQLQLLGEDLRKKMNAKIGRDAVLTIRFVHGAPGENVFLPLEPEAPLCPLRDAAPRELAEADVLSRLVVDPELAAIIAHAYLGAKRSGRT